VLLNLPLTIHKTLAFIMKKTKRFSALAMYWSLIGLVLSTSTGFSQAVATEHQIISTQGANDWKSFQIDSITYLALANYQNNISVEINSEIYKWDNGQFYLFQELPTKGASDWEYFSIDTQHFLAVANYKSDTEYEVNSTIYTWDGDSLIFFQDISTSAAYDWEAFTIGDTAFLAVANQLDAGGDYSTYSTIYKWNGVQFDSVQSVLTYGASDWEAFNIDDSLQFLAVANTYALTTNIFQWNGIEFVNFQVLLSIATTGIESFSIDNEHYLATSNGRDLSSFSTNSHIYKWDGTQFLIFQDIPTIGAFDWEFFSTNSQHFLCVANYQDDSNNYNLNSVIYIWDGLSFVSHQEILTNGATDFEFIRIDNNNYLAAAEYKSGLQHNIDSRLFILQDDITFVNEISKRQYFTFNLAPNPVVDQFLLNINSLQSGPVTVEIINMNGSLVHHQIVANTTDNINIWLPKLKSGHYLCRVRHGNKSSVQKFILR
jgi:hypothetical protein